MWRAETGTHGQPLSCTNVAEAQVDLDGRIHPRTAPRRDAWPLRLSCLLGDVIAGRARYLASAATPVWAPYGLGKLG
jgi:hypothetical protein